MKTKLFGLIGYPLDHSFSKAYFKEKFLREEIIDSEYKNFEISNLKSFISTLNSDNTSLENLRGFNVTMPYKEAIIPYLDYIDNTAKEVGAVNVVKIGRASCRERV